MAYDYVIVTDSSANLPIDIIEKYELEILSLNYYIEGKEIKGYEKGKETDLDLFFQMMREKKEITTSLVSTGDAIELFDEIAKKGKDILYIGFSSGLSGTFQAVNIAAQEVSKSYPDQKIVAVDSLAAALGEGMFVHYAIKNREQGMSLEENISWIEEHIQNLCHWITVDDLFFLKRGGRISATTAIVGTTLSIKPIIHVDKEGHLIQMEKVRGRKKSLDTLVKHMEETAIDPQNQMIYISHGDCLEDANYVADKIKEKFGVKEFMIRMLDPVIAAHAGPGTVALFYIGTER